MVLTVFEFCDDCRGVAGLYSVNNDYSICRFAFYIESTGQLLEHCSYLIFLFCTYLYILTPACIPFHLNFNMVFTWFEFCDDCRGIASFITVNYDCSICRFALYIESTGQLLEHSCYLNFLFCTYLYILTPACIPFHSNFNTVFTGFEFCDDCRGIAGLFSVNNDCSACRFAFYIESTGQLLEYCSYLIFLFCTYLYILTPACIPFHSNFNMVLTGFEFCDDCRGVAGFFSVNNNCGICRFAFYIESTG